MSYFINNKSYDNLYQVAKDAYKSSAFFSSYFKSDEFLKLISNVNQEKYEKIQKLKVLVMPEDVFVFRVSYILNPYMSFRLNGFCFKDLQSLGEAILAYGPDYNTTLMEIIRYQLLSKYMTSSRASKADPDLFKKVIEIEHLGENDSLLAYFMLGYLLSAKNSIIYHNKEYKNICNLTYYLFKEEPDLATLGNSLSHSALLKAYGIYHPEEKLDEFFHLIKSLETNEKQLNDFLNTKK